jgi:predicted transcriptional regulator
MQETMTIRVDAKTKRRLEKLANATARTKSYLAAEAIRAYLDMNEWQIQEIKATVQEADTAGPEDFIPHEKVREWLHSWGTKRERKAP